MTDDRRPVSDLESALRGHFHEHDPGPAPIDLRVRVDQVPATFERMQVFGARRLLSPVLGLAAALAVLALGLRLVPLSGLEGGTGASPAPTTAFDPNRLGLGLGPAFDATVPLVLVLMAVIALVGLATRWGGRRRLLPLVAAAGVFAYAAFGTLAPIDLQITGEGPGLDVTTVALPAGAEGTLYYETAKPGEPFSFGILLIGGTDPEIRIEGVVDDRPGYLINRGMRWASIWLDGEPNGGMMGPARPLAPFDMPSTGQAVWLVGRAGDCALGRAPVGNESLGVAWIPTVKLNVSVYGWPRVVELQLPRITEPASNPCAANGTPADTPVP